jgi:hypothetical protein
MLSYNFDLSGLHCDSYLGWETLRYQVGILPKAGNHADQQDCLLLVFLTCNSHDSSEYFIRRVQEIKVKSEK